MLNVNFISRRVCSISPVLIFMSAAILLEADAVLEVAVFAPSAAAPVAASLALSAPSFSFAAALLSSILLRSASSFFMVSMVSTMAVRRDLAADTPICI